MSTTVVHPESVSGTGPSGRTIGMVVAGLVVAAAVGLGIANQSAPETSGISGGTAVDTADMKYLQQGLELAAERDLLLKEATSGVVQSTVTETPSVGTVSETPLVELHPDAPLPERMDFATSQALTRAEASSGTAPFTERGDVSVGSVGVFGTITAGEVFDLNALIEEELAARSGISQDAPWPDVVGFDIPAPERFNVDLYITDLLIAEHAQNAENARNAARIEILNEMWQSQIERAQEVQKAQWQAKADYLAEQYKALSLPNLTPGKSGIQ